MFLLDGKADERLKPSLLNSRSWLLYLHKKVILDLSHLIYRPISSIMVYSLLLDYMDRLDHSNTLLLPLPGLD